jgi:two-component system NtrC family sensor kinase
MRAQLSREDLAGGRAGNETADFDVVLSEKYLSLLKSTSALSMVDTSRKGAVDLIALSRLDGQGRRGLGFIEEIISLDQAFADAIKGRLGLEVLLLDSNNNLVAATHPDFSIYTQDQLQRALNVGDEGFVDLTIREEPHHLIVSPIKWGDAGFRIALAASKKRSQEVLSRAVQILVLVFAGIIVFSVVLSFLTARAILRPIDALVDGIEEFDRTDSAVSIPVTTDNEVGVLTEAFNEMSQRVSNGKRELEAKVRELEAAYTELQSTQARLVHTAKMASLGQLVAGVAHELNNPIGFIHANMAHLREYSDKLQTLMRLTEEDPAKARNFKKEIDYDYIVEDLPRLIKSCEDGARRTRDIVVGLRNFSRLEEAQLKKVQLREGLEATLRMIQGEIKGRIQVETVFAEMPDVLCYASELNQVFMNLLTNAAQAIEETGTIHIDVRANGETAVVRIKDTGKGMAPETAERIFDPFFTTKPIGQGTGLGLSVSYGIIKKHGGDIQVQSKPGQGTEFIVSLPISGPPAIQSTGQGANSR